MTNFPDRSGKILILGIGNDILTDDGIGVRIIDDVQKLNFPSGIIFEKGTVGGLEILDMIQCYKEVVFFEAIKTIDGKPGEVYHMVLSDFIETCHLSNLHDVSFIQAIQLGKKLGFSLPDKISIFAVEIVEDRVFSRNFTPELEKCYPSILKEAESFIRKISEENDTAR